MPVPQKRKQSDNDELHDKEVKKQYDTDDTTCYLRFVFGSSAYPYKSN